MTIGEVGKKFNLPVSTLRYYESIGLIGPVNKTNGGIRDYSEDDIHRLEFVCCMKSAGISLDTIVKYMDLSLVGPSTLNERLSLLQKEKIKLDEKINELNETSKHLNRKIEWLENKIRNNG